MKIEEEGVSAVQDKWLAIIKETVNELTERMGW